MSQSRVIRTDSTRRGIMPRILIPLLASFLVVIGLIYVAMIIRPDSRRHPSQSSVVRVYCASGIAKPVEEIIRKYNEQFETDVEIVRTGGSGELAGQIKTEFAAGIADGADLYITADYSLLEKAFSEGLVAERFQLAKQVPVIAVADNSNLKIASLQDLVSNEIEFGIASKRAAVGKITRSIAEREGIAAALESQKIIDAENVMTLAQALVTGSLEAAIIWDTTVEQINRSATSGQGRLKIAAYADSSRQHQSNIAIGVVATTANPTETLRFSRFITSPEQGREVFQRYGFSFIAGDPWESRPEIHLYFGSMFTPVLEETVREFESREGIDIYPRWEGCGKLVAAMSNIDDDSLFPDGYLACDVSFMNDVQSFFEAPTLISNNDLVIAVRNNLSVNIQEPGDLLSHSLRIGICDPDQSALGSLTRQVLNEPPYRGLYQKIAKMSVVTVDVGPTLISQLAAGGLDAAFVYRSNILANARASNELRIVEFDEHSRNSMATQPWAISKTTAHANLMNRFYEWMARPEIISRFEAHGFQMIDK